MTETPLVTPGVDWIAILPAIVLAGTGVAIVVIRSVLRERTRWVLDISVFTALTGTLAAGVIVAIQWRVVDENGPFQTLAGKVALDGFAVFVEVVILIALLLTILLSVSYLGRERLPGPEYLALLVFSACGMVAMTTAYDLITVFLALEILSIALYVLVALDKRRLTSLEAGLKYFVLGAFSSAIFLYGISLVYGATGTTSIEGIRDYLATTDVLRDGVLLAGVMLLLVGFGFKVAAAPFHMWVPDVYQGAPTPITAFMSAATKAAAFAVLLRVMLVSFDLLRVDWQPAIWALAALSMLVGSIAALVQTDIKRMLAYSSISHAGYLLIGVEAASRRGVAAALFYLFAYTFMTLGAFGVVGVVTRRGDAGHAIDDYRGLARRDPGLAAIMTFFMLALAGVPLTGGFTAKLGVLSAGVAAESYALVVIAVVSTAVSVYFYLRVALVIYATEGDGEAAGGRLRLDAATGLVLAATALFTVALGVVPEAFLTFARDAILF